MNNERLPILVVCNSRHHSKTQIHLAESLADRDSRISVFVLCEAADIDWFKKTVSSQNTQVLSIDQEAPVAERNFSVVKEKSLSEKMFSLALKLNQRLTRSSKFLQQFARLVRESSLICLWRQRRNRKFFVGRMKKVDKIFSQIHPSVVFSFGDRHLDIEAAVLMVAHAQDIPVICPYCTYHGVEGLLKIRQLQGEPKRWWPFSVYRTIVGWYLPGQVRQGYFYQPPSITMAVHSLGGLSKNPWVFGNGLSDVVCVDNEFTEKRYLAEGVPSAKLRVVGDVSYDVIFEQFVRKEKLRQEIAQEYGLDAAKKTLIFALPQFAEQGVMGWDQHWQEIRLLTQQAVDSGFNVLISLHPRVNPQEYEFLERDFAVHVSRRPMKEILPVGDVFLAINSSTVFWAVLCGIPSVIIDAYGLSSVPFEHLKTVRLVNDPHRLSSEIIRAVEEGLQHQENLKEDWKNLSREKVFDGKVTERYYDIVTKGTSRVRNPWRSPGN
ncbi:MAG: hypothetical protein COT73_00350 [Bdellovibrio sp. CG10_big_fil_rev_8_21_14_0_10_47_8]|nr:MAG: hypothetical protein COT73_00350 [Bdellovibrio sp. CG10_big_fil_rev_8_21_14_0_10_47_8]